MIATYLLKIHRASLLISLMMLVLSCTSVAADDYKADGDWWRRVYGEVSASDNPSVLRAEMIFLKLWQTAQPVDIRPPRLIVISDKAEKWLDSWALTVADGTIVLVESVLDLAFDIDISQISNSRLAFVIAHELAHLAHKDHQRFGTPLLFQTLYSDQEMNKAHQAEIEADRYGIFLITMAGYDPKSILKSDQKSFFHEYESKVRKKIRSVGEPDEQKQHPLVQRRVQSLRERLENFTEELNLFFKGVELYHQGDFKKAEKQFEKFSQIFSSREVVNNLGLSFYQQAFKEIIGCHELHFKLQSATWLEAKTLGEKLKPVKISDLISEEEARICRPDDKFLWLVESAVSNFELAIKKDPSYWPARLNLSACMTIMGEYQAAIKQDDSILEFDKDNDFAIHNKAIVLYLSNTAKNKDHTVKLLKRLSNDSKVHELALQNLEYVEGKARKQTVEQISSDSILEPKILNKIKKD
jgi:tetratricopeptide (TPR) repeat protein